MTVVESLWNWANLMNNSQKLIALKTSFHSVLWHWVLHCFCHWKSELNHGKDFFRVCHTYIYTQNICWLLWIFLIWNNFNYWILMNIKIIFIETNYSCFETGWSSTVYLLCGRGWDGGIEDTWQLHEPASGTKKLPKTMESLFRANYLRTRVFTSELLFFCSSTWSQFPYLGA